MCCDFQKNCEAAGQTPLVAVQLLSRVQLFPPQWTAVRQPSLFFTVFLSLLKLMSVESMMPSNHLILCHLLLPLPSFFPSIRVFAGESAQVASGSQSIGASASASVFLMNIQYWFLLGLTSLSSLKSKELSRVFSSTTQFESISSLVLSLLCGPTLISVHDHCPGVDRIKQLSTEDQGSALLCGLFFLKTYIGVQLIYNVVLVSTLQHTDSVIYIYIYTYIYPLFFRFSYRCHCRALNRVPCAIQKVLISYLFYV